MENPDIKRSVYVNGCVGGVARVKAMKAEKSNGDGNMYVMEVPSISHYESGCPLHQGCWGHMCRAPSGIMLAPQSMSMRNGDITTKYLKASRAAFNNDRAEYMSQLSSTNLTKDGTMRSIMSSPVAGSSRLVVTSIVYKRDVLFVSQNLASKLLVPYIPTDADGVQSSVYAERPLRQGDKAMLVRPPPLTIWNTQPLIVEFWRFDCAGIHPETFTLFHGDFDGDELHIVPVYSEHALTEADAWQVPVYSVFEVARQRYMQEGHADCADSMYSQKYQFVESTTTSAEQMKDSSIRLSYGNHSRNKDTNMDAMNRRFNDSDVPKNFVFECVRGMSDICRQQLSQGQIGDMTRVAKIAAMCFFRKSDGALYVSSREGEKELLSDGVVDPGVPSVRAVMSICAVAQQAALDAHRVQESDMASHDFVSDIILSRSVSGGEAGDMKTLVVFSGDIPENVLSGAKPSWKYKVEDEVYTLCDPRKVRFASAWYIIGAYNPVVLTVCANARRDLAAVCGKGILTLCGYYNITLTDTELTDVTQLFTYMCSASRAPITSREGMLDRNLSWIETLEATDITKLPALLGHWQTPNTSTSAMFCGNFSPLL